MTEERAYWLAWSQISGVGPVLLKRLQQQFGSLEAAWQAPSRALAVVEGWGERLIEGVEQERHQLNPEKFLVEHSQKNPHFWTPADPDYPCLLLEIPSPPPVLYYQGQVCPQENYGTTPLIAIVGTRQPTEHGKRWTRRIAAALGKQGFTVVSGMAAGIDGEAHCSSVAAGGRTIAVLGTGVDVVYPSSHRQLCQQIQQQGLIISEYPAGTQPNRGNFPARNRIVAGLCRAVLVLEAPQQSGALITARYAIEFNRDVYALPNSPDHPQSQGCLQLLRQGAEVILAEDELLEMLGAIPELDSAKQLSLLDSTVTQPKPDLEPELVQVLGAIAFEPIPLDLVVQQAGLAAGAVTSALLQLELMGLVLQLPGMRYQRS